VLGGAVTAPLGWRWVFGLTVPPALLLLAGALLLAPADRPGSRATGRVDVLGAVTATGGLVALVFALTRSGWTDPATLGALAGGLALLGCFALVQVRVREPLVPAGLWRRPNLSAAVLVGFCNFAAWVGGNYYLSLTLQRVLGYASGQAALALVPMAVGGLVFATLAGRLLPRTGGKTLLVIGLSGYLLGFALLATLRPDTGYVPQVLAGVLVTVAGSALTYVASHVVAIAGAAPDEQSLVGGLFNAGMQVGGALGLAVMGAVAAARVPAGAQGPALLPGYQAAFWTAVGFAAAGLVTTVLGVSGRTRDARVPTGADAATTSPNRFTHRSDRRH
jgi:predicted MFS family arabinose efflux permease